MESENFGHEHAVVLLNEEPEQSNQTEVDYWLGLVDGLGSPTRTKKLLASFSGYCSRCGEKVSLQSAPTYGCVEEECEFYLHKQCGQVPLQINHPFHRNHPLLLLPKPPYDNCSCDFCNQKCRRFVYHCSICHLDFHIKCALFTYNIAQKNFKELDHVARLETDHNYEAEGDQQHDENVAKCFGCCQPLANSQYFSLDCGFNLHTKCADLPLKINHLHHPNHPLVLQFNVERLSCKICQQTQVQRSGFVYGCPSCKFVVHIDCVSAPPLPSIIEKDESGHPHPFTLFQRQVPFICDGCGGDGNFVAYICSTCHVMVHKECISLPRIIKSKWHDHRLFHKYFFRGGEREDFKSWDCVICHDEVNKEHGSYSCLRCKVIFHVKCITKYEYDIISDEDEESDESVSAFTVVEWNDAGEAIQIQHIKHQHNLMLSDKVAEYDKCCDGCLLPILAPFYYCPQCNFSLHKTCAELPKMKHFWFHHICQKPFLLQDYSPHIFECEQGHLSSGFAYECATCGSKQCLRCAIAFSPGPLTCLGHEHPLLHYGYTNDEFEGQYCSGCGYRFGRGVSLFRCKDCNFNLCYGCLVRPIRARHKYDEHLLTLTYHDDNDYSEHHYCDICEERRDPDHWFYHCATCDTSAHPRCVIEKYHFIRSGSIYQQDPPTFVRRTFYKHEKYHPHPLTFVRRTFYYPQCTKCGKPCQDLALQCETSGCNYIVHWKCKRPWGIA